MAWNCAVVVLVGLRDQPEELLRKLGIVPGTVPPEHTLDSFAAGVAFVRDELVTKDEPQS